MSTALMNIAAHTTSSPCRLRSWGRAASKGRCRTWSGTSVSCPPARESAITPDNRAPCHASGDLPSSSTTSSALGSRRAYSWAIARGVQVVHLVSRGHDQHGRLDLSQRLQPVPSRGARHLAQRLSHLERVLVALHALAHGPAGDLPPAVARAGRLGHVHEGVHAALLEPGGHRVPGAVVDVPRPGRPVVGRGDLDERGRVLGMAQGERHAGGGAHRAAHQRHPVEAQIVEHRLEVLDQIRIAVSGPSGGCPVAAGVIGDQPANCAAAGRASPARRCGAWRTAP